MHIRYSTIVVAMAGLLGSASPALAGPLTMYQVDLDTGALSGGAFGLDVQLTDGSGTGGGSSTVTLSGFDFGGGSTAGAAVLAGGASGDVSSGVTLIDSSFFNAFLQPFTAGSTLSFTLGVMLGGDLLTPDLFTLAILDGAGFEVPTQGLLGVEFLSYQYGDTAPQSFGSDPRAPFNVGAPVLTRLVTAPEPAALLLLGAGLLGVARARRRAAGRLR